MDDTEREYEELLAEVAAAPERRAFAELVMAALRRAGEGEAHLDVDRYQVRAGTGEHARTFPLEEWFQQLEASPVRERHALVERLVTGLREARDLTVATGPEPGEGDITEMFPGPQPSATRSGASSGARL